LDSLLARTLVPARFPVDRLAALVAVLWNSALPARQGGTLILAGGALHHVQEFK
jgi:hypothetical protein